MPKTLFNQQDKIANSKNNGQSEQDNLYTENVYEF